MNAQRREQLVSDVRMIVAEEDRCGRAGLDSTMVANRILRESLDALQESDKDLVVLDMLRVELNGIGAPEHDEKGHKLNVNGRLVDWLAGRREETWIGDEPNEVARLRVLAAAARTFWKEFGRSGDMDYPEGQDFVKALAAVHDPPVSGSEEHGLYVEYDVPVVTGEELKLRHQEQWDSVAVTAEDFLGDADPRRQAEVFVDADGLLQLAQLAIAIRKRLIETEVRRGK